MAKKTKKNNSFATVILGVIVLVLVFIVGGVSDDELLTYIKEQFETNYLEEVPTENEGDNGTDTTIVNGSLVIDYIDVGQGDSILIRQGEETMLIDGGTSSCKNDLLNFLEEENVDKFEYVIGTHPHEDHIGSLDDVINAYDADMIIFPKVTTNTKTFENLVNAVKNKGMKFTTPVVGQTYTLGDATFEILAPNSEKYSSLNNYSVVIKLTYGERTFMFTGDAESLAETEILELGEDLHADVLKLGHHGSTTSTSAAFLNAVNPSYAVICVGTDNTYNHPTKTTMDKMTKLGMPVYRTDEQGTIELVCDGKNISFNVEPGSYNYMGK